MNKTVYNISRGGASAPLPMPSGADAYTFSNKLEKTMEEITAVPAQHCSWTGEQNGVLTVHIRTH